MSTKKPDLSVKAVVALRRHITLQELLECFLKASSKFEFLMILSSFFDDMRDSVCEIKKDNSAVSIRCGMEATQRQCARLIAFYPKHPERNSAPCCHLDQRVRQSVRHNYKLN